MSVLHFSLRKEAVDIGCGGAERYQRVHVGLDLIGELSRLLQKKEG